MKIGILYMSNVYIYNENVNIQTILITNYIYFIKISSKNVRIVKLLVNVTIK